VHDTIQVAEEVVTRGTRESWICAAWYRRPHSLLLQLIHPWILLILSHQLLSNVCGICFATLRGITSQQRTAWHLARMSRGVGHIPAATGCGPGGGGQDGEWECSEEYREPREYFDDEMTEEW